MQSHFPKVYKVSFNWAALCLMICLLAASPLVGCKGALLDGVQSALTQADVAYKKAAIEIFSSLVFVPSLLTKDEVSFVMMELG